MHLINLCLLLLIILVSKSIGDQTETVYDSIKCKLARALKNQDVDKTELRSRKNFAKKKIKKLDFE